MELIVCGAGPAYTSRPGAVGASYLIRSGDDAILLDLGQGAFTNLAGAIEPSTLRAIFVSHLHPDHFVDLVSLRHYLRYEFEPPRRATVLGPAGIDTRLDGLHGQPGFASEALDVVGLTAGTAVRCGTLTVTPALVRHTTESYAFRVSAGTGRPGLVYSGDCGRADDLVPLIEPGDVLLSEVSFGLGPSAPGAEHLDAGEVGRVAAATGVRRVLLTHILSGHDRAATVAAVRELAGVETTIVDPGDRFTI